MYKIRWEAETDERQRLEEKKLVSIDFFPGFAKPQLHVAEEVFIWLLLLLLAGPNH